MPPKAQKTPTTGGKAPAGKAPAEKKEAGKKTAAPSGDKKKRTKSRKETYSSYIYKGVSQKKILFGSDPSAWSEIFVLANKNHSPEASAPWHRYLQQGYVDIKLICQRSVCSDFWSLRINTNLQFTDIFERVATEASKLAAYNKKSTISSREIQTS